MIKKHRFCIHKHLIPVICVVFLLFLPRLAVAYRPYLLCIMLWLFLLNRNAMSLGLSELGNVYYAFTFFLSLIIHVYSGSIGTALSFFGFFVCAPSVVEQQIWSRHDFEQIISLMLVLSAMYAALGAIEALTQFNLFDVLFNRSVIAGGANNYRGGVYRGHGLFTVSINNAIFMNMMWSIANYRLCNTSTKKRFWAFIWIIIGLDVLLILSRAVIAVGVLTQLIMFKKKGMHWTFTRLIMVIPIIAIICLLNAGVIVSFITYVKSLFYPILNELFGTTLSASSGEKFAGSGQRFLLWKWVFERVHGNLLFGKGFTSVFSYNFVSTVASGIYAGVQYAVEKNSIEVHWLYVLYQKGLFGLSGFIVYQISCLRHVMKAGISTFEKTVSFQYVMRIIVFSYFILLFTCSGFEDLQFFYVLFGLYRSYERICHLDREELAA